MTEPNAHCSSEHARLGKLRRGPRSNHIALRAEQAVFDAVPLLSQPILLRVGSRCAQLACVRQALTKLRRNKVGTYETQ
jgi:hypothetical protein